YRYVDQRGLQCRDGNWLMVTIADTDVWNAVRQGLVLGVDGLQGWASRLDIEEAASRLRQLGAAAERVRSWDEVVQRREKLMPQSMRIAHPYGGNEIIQVAPW